MGIYKEAAEVLIKRQFGIYGPERVKPIATASGYAIDNSGNILSVGDEEKALRNFWERVGTELGIIATTGSKLALTWFFLQKEKDPPDWLK